MKKTKKSSNTVTRIISIAITFALILCAVLSFGYIYIPQGALADGEDNTPTATQENIDGVRFVQVAAGSDFAIGLTFDGDLYGWSLLPETGSPCAGTNTYLAFNDTVTLGQYYSTTPTKINVKLIEGPSASEANKWGQGGYNSPNTTDRIKEIAATRTTAAFVTENGYIYTWGNDTISEGVSITNEAATYHYLLLRVESNDYKWCEPYMINYNPGFGNDWVTIQINPTGSGFVGSSVSIAAGEYNYTILYAKNSRYNTYVWGSLMYSVPNTGFAGNGYSYAKIEGGATSRLAFDTGRTSQANISVVAGGYTVGINNANRGDGTTSLQLRGKNFLTSTGSQSNIVYTTETYDNNESKIIDSANTLAEKGIIGGKQTKNGKADLLSCDSQGLMSYTNDDDTLRLGASDNYYGRQAADSTSNYIDYKQTRTGNVTNAHGGALTGNTIRLYGVSLGNDIGYGVDGNGALYAWGDNGCGQLTSAVAGDNATKPTQINGADSVLSGKIFNTVAAGKQLSGTAKAFHASNTFVADGDNAGQFNANVKNVETFISGAVTTDGALYVWSNKNPTPVEVKYGNYGDTVTPQNGDKFSAVYSGYGNHLFAITKLGKLVHITYKATETTTGEGDDVVATTIVTYEQERYDTFRKFVVDENGIVITENGVAQTELIKNWEVNSANTVHFTNADVNHSQYATFYVWQGENIDATTVSTATAPTTYDPLVSLNHIGDAYRILGGNDKDNSRSFLNEVAGRDDIETFAPVYKYAGVVMNEKQRNNMFIAEIVNDGNGVGIRITPKQSSKGKTITIDFYIARYASTADVTASNNVLSDHAQYYDYKPCRISFDIADTATQLAFGKYAGGATSTDTNSLIPLLDPNNDYNNTYSVAVQNVSGGIEALFDYFSAEVTPATNVTKTTFSNAVADLMAAEDPGYPLAAKRAADKGNLDYYLGERVSSTSTTTLAETLYYSNKYQYLYSDIDADRVKISSDPNKIGTNRGSATAIDPKTVNITVSFDLATYFTGIQATDDLITQFKKDFNNLYGFYDVYFGPKNDTEAESGKTATTITFTYDIVTFDAKEATGLIGYDVPESNTDTPISSYKTDATASGVLLSVTPSVETYDFNATAENNAYVPINASDLEGREIIAVYSMPSLRMKSEYNVNKTDENPGTQINGQSTSVHVYKEIYSSPIYIGKPETIYLRKYFDSLGNDMIKFSFKNGAANADYGAFNSQFMDETGNGVSIVELTSNSLKIEPTTTNPIKLTVVMQRFANGNNATFGANEKIEATFLFNNIVDFTFAQPQNIRDTYTVTKEETISLFGADGALNFGLPLAVGTLSVDPTAQALLMSKVKITGLTSSEDDVNNSARLFDARPFGATSLIITPRRSGTGTVQFIATVYGKSVFYSLTINVSAVTVIDDSITVVDDQYIYIETFTNKLKEANSFAENIDQYDILYTDVADPEAAQLDKRYNAIYFTEGSVDGDPLTDPPAFIRNAVIQGVNAEGKKTETKPSIRIISADSSVDTNKTYYMHVRFINKVAAAGATTYAEAPAGTVLEAVIPVVSGKVVVNAYSVDINCRDPKSDENGRYTITGSGVDTKVTVRVSSLLDSLGGNIESSTEYKISIVSAEPEVSEYLNYSRGADQKTIIITPLYNTPEGGCQISVSASYNNDSKVLLFYVNIDGITTVLPVTTDENGVIGYGNIWLYSFLIVFGVLAVIFVIRMIVYWKKRAKQRALIKRNQELIRLRDRMHNKASIATKEQVVKTKLKMNDPKYAKMFNDMRKNKEEESGVILENSELAATADAKVKKNKKKKGGKKSVAELKAELEAKKAAFAAAQAQGAQPVNPFAAGVPPMDGGDFAPPVDDFGGAQSIDGSDIVFDASDMGEGM